MIKSSVELEKLNAAFRTFSEASEKLQTYYQSLKNHIQYLSEELQKKNEQLKKTLGFLESVIQSMDEAVIVLDQDKRVIMMNRTAEELFGIKQSDATEKATSSLPIEGDQTEVVINTTKGERIFYVSMSEVKTDTENAGYVVLFRDITAIKEKEAEASRNRRLIAMGEMMATIVHELRNPLCSIELYASMLHRELEGTSYESLARGVSSGVQTLNNFLSNMLYFAKPRSPKLSDCDLNTVVKEAISLISPVIQSRNISIELNISNVLLKADAALLKQVIMNILLNAVQAMDSAGKISIHSETSNGYLQLSIKDTGPGIDKSTLDRIFDPFYTTKDEGTGLGLSISLKIMQAHGGTISVRSTPGEGSTFILHFPENLLYREVEHVNSACC